MPEETQKRCPACGSPLIEKEGTLDQSSTPIPAIITYCGNYRSDLCGYKRWDRKIEK